MNVGSSFTGWANVRYLKTKYGRGETPWRRGSPHRKSSAYTGQHRHTKMQTYIYAPTGFRTHSLRNGAVEDSTRFGPHVECGWQITKIVPYDWLHLVLSIPIRNLYTCLILTPDCQTFDLCTPLGWLHADKGRQLFGGVSATASMNANTRRRGVIVLSILIQIACCVTLYTGVGIAQCIQCLV
jgi:hypothetical protein